MTARWNLDHLIGYLGTWSATQRFISARGSDPLNETTDELRIAWGDPQQMRKVIWPLILRIGVKATSEAPKE
jgi:hypothetical protein